MSEKRVLEEMVHEDVSGDGVPLPLETYLSYMREANIQLPGITIGNDTVYVTSLYGEMADAPMESFRAHVGSTHPSTWLMFLKLGQRYNAIMGRFGTIFQYDKHAADHYLMAHRPQIDEYKRYAFKVSLLLKQFTGTLPARFQKAG